MSALHTDSSCSPHGAGRPVAPVAGLRALIRNGEALVEHYDGRILGEDLSIAQRVELLSRRARVLARLNAHRDQLSAALPPASTSRATNIGDNSGPGTYAPEPTTTAAR
jgi:hypothetical protein